MALGARPRRRADAGRELAVAPAPALDGCAGPAGGAGCRENPDQEEVMSDATESETTLRLERLIAAPPELLYALWTEPAELVRWFAPQGYEVSVDVLDTRPGGGWRTTVRGSDGDQRAMSGVYR